MSDPVSVVVTEQVTNLEVSNQTTSIVVQPEVTNVTAQSVVTNVTVETDGTVVTVATSGLQGPKGDTGEQGPQGDPGPAGEDATVQYATSGTLMTVSVSTTNTQLAAADADRVGLTIMNTSSTGTIFIAYGFLASTTDYTIGLGPGEALDVPTWAVKLQINAVSTSGTISVNVTEGT